MINREEEEAAIVNVSSGLGFLPAVGMPIYSTTKAAMHIEAPSSAEYAALG